MPDGAPLGSSGRSAGSNSKIGLVAVAVVAVVAVAILAVVVLSGGSEPEQAANEPEPTTAPVVTVPGADGPQSELAQDYLTAVAPFDAAAAQFLEKCQCAATATAGPDLSAGLKELIPLLVADGTFEKEITPLAAKAPEPTHTTLTNLITATGEVAAIGLYARDHGDTATAAELTESFQRLSAAVVAAQALSAQVRTDLGLPALAT